MTAPRPGDGGSPTSSLSADVIVVGAGLVGLASTLALADRGMRVLLVNDTRRGEASPAAAGMLAPSVEREIGPAHEFGVAARDHFPVYLAALRERTGIDVPLNRLGVLRLALDDREAEGARASLAGDARWLDGRELAELEPALTHAAGAVFHPDDGAVNNLVLMRALKHAVGTHGRVQVIGDAVTEVAFGNGQVRASTRDERQLSGGQLVLAAGAWAGLLPGLPRPIPVEPVRGQMMSVVSKALRRVVYGGDGYVVPRHDGRTLVGATMERVGFDADFTEGGVETVRRLGAAIVPALAGARMLNAWAGLRPMTPDGLPILDRDPDQPALLYACGHSRNGVLMAPLTGECIADLATGERPGADLGPFSIRRFGPRGGSS